VVVVTALEDGERRAIRHSKEKKQRKEEEEDQIAKMPHDSFYCHYQKLPSNCFHIEEQRLFFPYK